MPPGRRVLPERERMDEAVAVYPNQLFQDHPGFAEGRPVYLVEEERFFTDFRYHRKKILLHRASMKAYEDLLARRGHQVRGIPLSHRPTTDSLFSALRQDGIMELHLVDVCDAELERRIDEAAARYGVAVHLLPTPAFLTPLPWIESFFEGKEHYSLTQFYIAQRRRMNLLMEGDRPKGGKWTYDTENRRKLPRGVAIPEIPSHRNRFWEGERSWVEENFPGNPGTTSGLSYPVTHGDASAHLRDFLTDRLPRFGEYQDAMREECSFLFHSLLSAPLNVGLLTPDQIVQATLKQAEAEPIPMNSLEGFLRQIVGWREFVRAVYVLEGERQRRSNFWRSHRGIPKGIYHGRTRVRPVDMALERLRGDAYLHHIERLMVLGNYFMLTEVEPEKVYRWFMEMFIDAYDWVMVPNVFGMSQFADGGLMTTKPYLCSSNYLLKMGDFRKGKWCDLLDSLYWRFIHRNEDVFRRNPRMAVMAYHLHRMDEGKKAEHLRIAEEYLSGLEPHGPGYQPS
jgi:deoxyribodipyrimidine photolyase-related protein